MRRAGRSKRHRTTLKRIAEAQGRMDRLSTSELHEWAEQCQYHYGRCLLDSRRAESPSSAANMLEEAILAADVGGLIAREIQSRIMK